MPVDRISEVRELARPGARGAAPWVTFTPAGPAPVTAGREGVVRERLYRLLTTLGELPAPGPGRLPEWPGPFSAVLDELGTAGHVVLHGRRVPERALLLEDLVVASVGVVVVGHGGGPGPRAGYSPRGASRRGRQPAGGVAPGAVGAGPRRPGLVRDTLKRTFALRAWLGQTAWAGVPVYAAVCSPPAPALGRRPAIVLDGLWVGFHDQLGPWLASADELGPPRRADLGSFLARELLSA